jgi:hypothetical protein
MVDERLMMMAMMMTMMTMMMTMMLTVQISECHEFVRVERKDLSIEIMFFVDLSAPPPPLCDFDSGKPRNGVVSAS